MAVPARCLARGLPSSFVRGSFVPPRVIALIGFPRHPLDNGGSIRVYLYLSFIIRTLEFLNI